MLKHWVHAPAGGGEQGRSGLARTMSPRDVGSGPQDQAQQPRAVAVTSSACPRRSGRPRRNNGGRQDPTDDDLVEVLGS